MPYRVDMGGRVIVDADTVEEVQALIEARDRLRAPMPKAATPVANHSAARGTDLVGIGSTRFKLITRRHATRIAGPFCTVCGEKAPGVDNRCSNAAVIDSFGVAFGPLD